MISSERFCSTASFDEGIFYPKVFTDEDKATIRAQSVLFSMAMELHKTTIGSVFIVGYRLPEPTANVLSINLVTREGLKYGDLHYSPAEETYTFEGMARVKQRGNNPQVCESKRPAYLMKSLKKHAGDHLRAAYSHTMTAVNSALARLKREALPSQEPYVSLSADEDRVALEALFAPGGRTAVQASVLQDMERKYEDYKAAMVVYSEKIDECAKLFGNDAWICGVSDKDVLVGQCRVSYDRNDKAYSVHNVNMHHYKSFEDVDPQIRDELKLNLVMLKAHLSGHGRMELTYVDWDTERLFPIMDSASVEFTAATYCSTMRPNTHNRQWTVIAK